MEEGGGGREEVKNQIKMNCETLITFSLKIGQYIRSFFFFFKVLLAIKLHK